MIKIRDAQFEDALILSAAEKKITEAPGYLVSRPHEVQDSSFRQKIETLAKLLNGKYIVAENDHNIMGHAFLDPMGLEAIQHVVRLTIAVHPDYGEKGLGELLLSYLVQWAKDEPLVEKIELNVRATNIRAIRLYQKVGFYFEGRIQNRIKDFKGNYNDDLLMGLFVKDEPFTKTAVCLAIGKVISSRKEAFDDDWDKESSRIELDPRQFSLSHKRGKNRPNQIGTTICRILKVNGLSIYLEGLDAIDGTPVLDIKPWVREFGPRGEVRQPAWMDELMSAYWKKSSEI